MARKTSAKHIVSRDIQSVYLRDVMVRIEAKIISIGLNGKPIYLGGKYAFATKAMHSEMKTTYTCEKIDKFEVLHFLQLERLGV